jgi:hypothetical protein
MTDDARSSNLRTLRLDDDALRHCPDRIRAAVEVITAYVYGLTDGYAGESLRESLDERAEEAYLEELRRGVRLPMNLSVCGAVYGDPAPPIPEQTRENLPRDVVVVWGYCAHQAIRQALD